MGKAVLKWKKMLLDWLPSCARAPRTLGTTWSATRSTKEGAHRRSVDFGDEIQRRGRGSGARAAKPSAKAP
jgi:hypothetical protein